MYIRHTVNLYKNASIYLDRKFEKFAALCRNI